MPPAGSTLVSAEVSSPRLRAGSARHDQRSRAPSACLEKIRLKSAIDDLIDCCSALHPGAMRYTQAGLQERYDLRLMRIATLLQQNDWRLHGQPCNPLETIWLDRVDCGRFAKRSC